MMMHVDTAHAMISFDIFPIQRGTVVNFNLGIAA
jgi:hypothetical protein